jgi:tRNA(adenine34) deaminase
LFDFCAKGNADSRRFHAAGLEEAQLAGRRDEVPVGAVLVSAGGEVLAAAGNRTIGAADPTAHAEILALRAAAQTQNYRLLNTTLYVTIEPCPMCMGAILHARVAQARLRRGRPQVGGRRLALSTCRTTPG